MFSIIIPTYNRSDNLNETLIAYQKQTSPELIKEIIVIDDGSEDINKQNNENIIDNFRNESPIVIKYIYQNNKGPAEARNNGINIALGEIILFTGDDIVPHPDMVKEHFLYHKKFDFMKNICVLGMIEWPIGKKVTPFMKHIHEHGLQFGYSVIDNENDLLFTFFYASNISLQRTFLLEDQCFDCEFPFAAWEDIELAYRMKKRGLRIVLNKKAIGYHHHDISLNSFRKRQEICGYSANIFHKKHPELRDMLGINYTNRTLYNKLHIKLIEIFCLFADKYLAIGFPDYYNLVLNYYYQNGINKYFRKNMQ